VLTVLFHGRFRIGPKHRLNSLDSSPFMIREQMTVSLGHGQGLMSEEFLDCQDGFSSQCQPARKRVPKCVEGEFLTSTGI
jgi:hypothetical protein